ncbi:hypothetical protein SLA2020_062420 [Shorea laevis]
MLRCSEQVLSSASAIYFHCRIDSVFISVPLRLFLSSENRGVLQNLKFQLLGGWIQRLRTLNRRSGLPAPESWSRD